MRHCPCGGLRRQQAHSWWPDKALPSWWGSALMKQHLLRGPHEALGLMKHLLRGPDEAASVVPAGHPLLPSHPDLYLLGRGDLPGGPAPASPDSSSGGGAPDGRRVAGQGPPEAEVAGQDGPTAVAVVPVAVAGPGAPRRRAVHRCGCFTVLKTVTAALPCRTPGAR